MRSLNTANRANNSRTAASVSEWIMDSPIGRLRLVSDGAALTAIDFHARGPGSPGAPADRVLRETVRQLGAYFEGRLRTFQLPLAPQGTPFQRAVWEALLAVPYGATTSYGAIAERVGRPRAVRAVGAANGANPIPIVIPCHRIIGKSGALTGYGGGLSIKEHLLKLEGVALV